MTIATVQQFHDELLAIAKLGIPLSLEFDRPTSDLSAGLDEIAVTLKQAMRDEQPLAESISNIPRHSPAYRSALATWLATDGSPIAFESLVAPAVARQQTRSLWNLSLLQPLVILAISYVVMIYICSFTIPKLEAIYEQSGHQPHFASALMIGLRKSMMIWIPAMPIFVGVFFFLRKRQSKTHSNKPMLAESLHGSGRILDAVYAEQVAELLKSQVALPVALEIFQSDRTKVSNSIDAKISTESSSLRPMLQWAVSEASDAQKIRSLQMVAATYRALGFIQRDRIKNWIPPLAMGVLGGCLVLGVGLSVFWPMAELLYELAKPGITR